MSGCLARIQDRVEGWRDRYSHVLLSGPSSPAILRLFHRLGEVMGELDGTQERAFSQPPNDVLEQFADPQFHRSALRKCKSSTEGSLSRPRGTGSSSTEEHVSAVPVVLQWAGQVVTVNIHSVFVSGSFFEEFFRWLEKQPMIQGTRLTVMVVGVQRLSLDCQSSFLNPMEKLAERVRFLLFCDGGTHQLLDAVVSRCHVVRVPRLDLTPSEGGSSSSQPLLLFHEVKRRVLLPRDHWRRPTGKKWLEESLPEELGPRVLWLNACRRELLCPLMVQTQKVYANRTLSVLVPKFMLMAGELWVHALVEFCDLYCLPHDEVLSVFLTEYYMHLGQEWLPTTIQSALHDHLETFALLRRQPASARWALSSLALSEISHHKW